MNTLKQRLDGRASVAPRCERRRAAFTLIELVVVAALLALVATTLLPAFAKSSAPAPAVHCLNNLRQLQAACAMYAADHGGRVVSNYGGTWPNLGRWATGWLGWSTSADNTNSQYLYNAALGPYTARNRQVYKCPSDRLLAANGPRVRSYSMNGFVGGAMEYDLYGLRTYRIFLKEADFALPGPARTFIFVDEHPDSINDEVLGLRMPAAASWPSAVVWDDVPASHHNGAGAFSFADGHSELRKWVDDVTKAPVRKINPCSATGSTSTNDYRWLAARASAPL